MSRLSVLLTALACLLSSPALAIDCTKARQDFERAICADPKLVAADDELNRFYFDRLRALSGDAHDLLQADQRRWIEMRGGDCRPLTAACLPRDIAARRRAIAICSRPADTPPDDPKNEVDCPYFHHGGCPSLDASGSAGLARYPFLVARLVSGTRNQIDMFDCVPDPEQSPPRTNILDAKNEIAAERPGYVFLLSTMSYCARGAAHCYSEDGLDAYDAKTQHVVSFSELFNGIKADSPVYDGLMRAIDGKLDVPCCGDDAKVSGATLGDLNLETVLPSGWHPTPEGDLVVGYQYNALGRTFLSRATIPRATFITAVAPKYTALFDPPRR